MNVLVAKDYEAMSRLAAELMLARIAWKPHCLAGFSQGETPVQTYRLLCERLLQGPVNADDLRVLQINEWLGVSQSDPVSCGYHFHKEIVEPLKLPAERVIEFQSDAQDTDVECRRMRDLLQREGPLDLVVLGLGLNGHLGWNEPGDSLARSVYLSELSETTQHHNLLGGVEHPPTFGLTLGMGDLLQAHHVLLLVSGEHKQEQMKRLMDRDISTAFPASLLWTHPDAVCICDEAAYEGCRGLGLPGKA
jgi:galactosamine-6-phosphate isomerase